MNSDHLPTFLQRLDDRADALRKKSRLFSRMRLGLALLGIAAALVVGQASGAGNGWLVAVGVIVVFSVLVRIHDRIEVARRRLALWRQIQARRGARVTLDWDALPPAPEAPPPHHAFASDLDLAGPRSLLHLLDATGTSGASRRLRAWCLAEAPDPDAAALRQRRVRALVPRRRLRDRFALLAHTATGSADTRWEDAPVRAWLATSEIDRSIRVWAVILCSLAALTFGLIVLALTGGPSFWGYSFATYIILYLARYSAFSDVFDQSYDLQRGLGQIAPLLTFAEHDPASGDPDLAPMWEPLVGESAPSHHLQRLRRITSAAAVTRNDVARVLFNAILPYDLLLTLALNRLRTDLARLLPPWLDAIYEIEALGVLADAHAIRPEHTSFPALLASGARAPKPPGDAASGAAPLFTARGLRHPLLPLNGARGNDVALGAGAVVVVTGSNMSGKSTFLRAVGVASVLAWAGGPVWADSVAAQPLRPFASMRIGDVLQEGLSTFYAEVRRLKALLDSVEPPEASGGTAFPSLVLIDEMLRGTNNRERLAGAQAIVRALAGAHATSLVATHDLALADLEQENSLVSNAHFRERAEGERLVFDYLLREGPCPTTNALVIMKRAGLPVELDE